jgi:hypothetical protein
VHDHTANGAVLAALSAYFLFIAIVGLALIALHVIVYWRIASKAGYNGALSLLMFVPLANFIVLIIFAFSEWPIEHELRLARAGVGATPPGWQPPMPAV